MPAFASDPGPAPVLSEPADLVPLPTYQFVEREEGSTADLYCNIDAGWVMVRPHAYAVHAERAYRKHLCAVSKAPYVNQ